MPQPSAAIIVLISSELSILSMRAFSTLRILPLDRQDRLEAAVAALLGRSAGRIALDDVDLGLRRIASPGSRRACRAASCRRARPCGAPGRGPCAPPRARARHRRPSSRHAWRPPGSLRGTRPSLSLTIDSTMPLTSVLPSLVLVWPSNCGRGILTLMTAVMPSRMSSPLIVASLRSLVRLLCCA